MTRNKSNGAAAPAGSGQAGAAPASAGAQSAMTTPMFAFDAFRAMLDASWSATARLWTVGEDLRRLQSTALDGVARAIAQAARDAENARDVQDLLKVQIQLAESTLEETAELGRAWLERLISLSSDLTPVSTAGPTTSGFPVSAVSHVGTDGSTIWPTDLLFNGPTAWSQWAQQLARTVNRGIMPS